MAEWITVKDAAQILNYDPVHVRRLLKAGEIEGHKFSTAWLVDHQSVLAYFDKWGSEGKKRGPKKTDNQL